MRLIIDFVGVTDKADFAFFIDNERRRDSCFRRVKPVLQHFSRESIGRALIERNAVAHQTAHVFDKRFNLGSGSLFYILTDHDQSLVLVFMMKTIYVRHCLQAKGPPRGPEFHEVNGSWLKCLYRFALDPFGN